MRVNDPGFKRDSHWPLATLQMKRRWESNLNVWLPFMYFQQWNWYFQNRIIMFSFSVPTLIYLWQIYIFPGSVCLFCCSAGKYVDRSREYINPLQTHECWNGDWGRAIPRKGIYKWNFPCSAVNGTVNSPVSVIPECKWRKGRTPRREDFLSLDYLQDQMNCNTTFT